MIFFKKLLNFIRDLWMIIGITLAILICLEFGVKSVFFIRSFWHKPVPNFRTEADTYKADGKDASWPLQYYKELDEMGRLRWRSYVYWRRQPSQGKYINISQEGLRLTTGDAENGFPTQRKKVFMFGGSTLWGLGARDDFTVPSLFTKEAAQKGIECQTENFGQYAYVSTQGVIELMMQLQRGNVPDAVIFMDGINDTFGAFQVGVAGLPHAETAREKEFNLMEKKEIRPLALQFAVRQLSTMRLLGGMSKKLGLATEKFQIIPLDHQKPASDPKLLSKQVAEVYLNNVRIVHALSKQFGFKCMFYWQPVIYLKNHLSEYERYSVETGPNYPGMKEFYMDTYANLQRCSGGLGGEINFFDISSIFRDVKDPLYVDFNHVGEKGNSIIAQRMAEDFSRLVK